ncbi:uncharacterized protein DDB_G0290685-like [Asparagus officinalis]|uniref:uncharacterized protein DDB_G0290685-like n=1 Tax=Asparagus officinalis TaxID=4686 RepID=UPI00098E373C|nr:uncharacterized protein DDB_G0290685-like [Asparagus officinalis]XP_020256321.1 uncharacterized protein DDB_G0290685-like [Asparagus officinalis]
MLRQASSRNQRSKGFKVKHTLQILLLVAICIWLLYQVKHSHEKKKAFEERNSKIMNKIVENEADFFKFGRKDLPHTGVSGSINEAQNKEEDNEDTQEEDEDHDTKQQEIEEEEGRGAGDDEIDEQDNEKGDEEAEQGEESIEEEDNDNHEDGKDSHEEVDVFDNQEHEGGTQEAREENYKRDDASSAVVNEEQVVDKTDDNLSANDSKGDDVSNEGSKNEVVGENLEKKVEESKNDGAKGNNNLIVESGSASVSNVSDTGLKDNETIQINTTPSNVTVFYNNDAKVEFSKPENYSVSNLTTVELNGQIEQQSNLRKEAESNTQIELQLNSTGNISELQAESKNNSTMGNSGDISMSNDTVSLHPAPNQNAVADNATQVEGKGNLQNEGEQTEYANATTVSSTNENGDAARGQSEEQSTTSTKNENEDAAAQAQGESDNSSHSVITVEEREARMDLSTLPDIQNEVRSTDDEVAE